MGLNFLGLGFSFGAKDMGLEKMQKSVTSGFTGIVRGIGEVNKVAQPAAAGVNKALDGVIGEMDRTAATVDRWSRSFAAQYENAAASVDSLREHFKPLEDTFESGMKAVSMAWDATLGPAVESVKGRIAGVGESFRGILEAAQPVTSRLTSLWDKYVKSVEPATKALDDVGKAAEDVAEKQNESTDKLSQYAERFKQIGEKIEKTLTTIQGGFGFVRDSIRKMGESLNVNKLREFISGLSSRTLDKFRSSLQALQGDALNLTNSLEAQGVAMAKESKKTAVNLGLTGKELRAVTKQAGGMAIALNIGAGEATEAIVGWRKSAEMLRHTNIKSAKDLAALADVTGLSAKQYAHMMEQMHKLHMSGEDIKGVTATFIEMGRVSGNVGESLGKLPEMITTLSDKAALMGMNLQPKQLASFAKQTAALGAAMAKATGRMEEAPEVAMGLAKSMVSAQKQFQNLRVAAAEDIPELMQRFAHMGINMGDTFDLMQHGPAGMVQGLYQLLKATKESGGDVGQALEFIRGRLEGVEGFDSSAFIRFLQEADEGTMKMMASTMNSTASLGQLQKEGFSAGRTLQEAFEMAEQQFETAFRAMGKGRQAFVKNTTKTMGQMQKAMKGAQGPTKVLLGMFADMHALGAKGLLPEFLQPFVHILGMLLKTLAPVGAGIGVLAVAFGPLGAVIGAAAVALTVFLSYLYKVKKSLGKGKTWGDAFNAIGEDVEKFAKKLPGEIDKAAKSIEGFAGEMEEAFKGVKWSKTWGSVLKSLKKSVLKLGAGFVRVAEAFWLGLTGQFDPKGPEGLKATSRVAAALGGAIVAAVKKLRGLVTTKLLPALVDLAKGVFAGLTKGFDPSSAEGASAAKKIGGAIGNAIKAGLGMAKEAAKNYFAEWWKGMTDLWADPSKSFKEKAAGTFKGASSGIIGAFALSAFLPIGKIIGGVISAIGGLVSAAVSLVANWGTVVVIAKAVGGALSTVISTIFSVKGAIIALVAALAALTAGFMLAPAKTEAFVEKAKKWLAGLGAWIVDKLAEWGPKIWNWFVTTVPDLIIKGVPMLLAALRKAVGALGEMVGSLLMGMLGKIRELIAKHLPEALPIFDGIVSALQTVQKVLGVVVDLIFDGLILGWNTFWTIAKPILSLWWKGFKFVLGVLWDVVIWVGTHLVKGFQAMWAVVGPVLTKMWENVKKAWAKMQEGPGIMDRLGVAFDKVWKAAKPVVDLLVLGFKVWWAITEPILSVFWEGIKVWWTVLKFVAGVIWDGLVVGFKALWVVVEPIWGVIKIGAVAVWKVLESIGNIIHRVLIIGWKLLAGAATAAWREIESAWNDLKTFFKVIWADLVAEAAAAWVFIQDKAIAVWEKHIKPVWEGIKGAFQAIFAALWGVIKPYWDPIEKALIDTWNVHVKPIWDGVKKFFKGVFGDVGSTVDTVISDIIGYFDNFNTKVDEVFDTIETWVDNLFGNSISTDIKADLDKAVGFFADTWKAIKATAGKLFKWFGTQWGLLKKAAVGMWKAAETKAQQALDGVKRIWTDSKKGLEDAFKTVQTAVENVFKKVKKTILGAFDFLVPKEGKKTLWDKLVGFFTTMFDPTKWEKELKPLVKKAIKFITDPLIDAWKLIKTTWEGAKTYFKEMFETIRDSLKKVLQEIADKIGKAMGPLVIVMENLKAAADKAFGNSIHTDAEESLDKLFTYTKAARKRIGPEFEGMFGDVERAAHHGIGVAEGDAYQLAHAMGVALDATDAVSKAKTGLRDSRYLVETAGAVDLNINTKTLRDAVNQPDWWTAEARNIFLGMRHELQEIKRGMAPRRAPAAAPQPAPGMAAVRTAAAGGVEASWLPYRDMV